jgi:hypothetical protein
MHPSRLLLVLIGIGLVGLALACSRSSEDPRDAAFQFITVTTAGPVNVSFWRSDGTPATPDAANERPTSQRHQEFQLRTKQPVVAKFAFTQAEPVTITVQVWDKGHSFLYPAGEVTKDARFVVTEPPGTLATLTFSRDSDFDDLRLEIDHGADGTVDAERAPEIVEA